MTHDFAPISDTEWPDAIADMKDGFAGRLNVYRAMAHHPALLRAWADLRQHVVRDNALGAERSEVVILRAGHRLDADYEWAHHVSRGRALGLSDARIASIACSPADMDPKDAVLATAVDELLDHAQLSAKTCKAIAALASPEGVFDVMAMVGFYSTLAFIVKSFAVPVDDPVAAEPALTR